MEELGIRLRIAPAFGEVRSMRGIRMRFEEQPGSAARPAAIPAAIRRGLEKRPEVRLRPAPTPTTCCATPEGTERQEEDVAQDLGDFRSIGG